MTSVRHGGAAPYDALVLLSFGGPNKPEDVVPFLRNVTAGKGIPDERLAQVGQHYTLFGGKSPINEANMALVRDIEAELVRRGIDLPVYWGNRNWEPYTTDVLAQAHRDGVRRLLAVPTSAFSSYSSCRQYREDIAASLAALDRDGIELQVDKVRPYFNTPGFVAANARAIVAAYRGFEGNGASSLPHLVFVTHSIPIAMELGSGSDVPGGATYSAQHLSLAKAIVSELERELGRAPTWELAYCSRSGPPSQPWLEPDVNDVLTERQESGLRDVVLAPIGFVSDHMEVVYDLDTEAAQTCSSLGVRMVRAGTAGTDPVFVAGLVDHALERAAVERGESVERAVVGDLPAWPDRCGPGCCRRIQGVDSGIPAAGESAARQTVSARG